MKIPEIYRAKWPLALLGEGFLPFSKSAVRCMAKILDGPQSIEDLAMLMTIIDYRRPNLEWDPSLEYLAFTSGSTVVEAQASLERLKEKSLISVEPSSLGRLRIDPSGFYRAVARHTLSDADEELIDPQVEGDEESAPAI